MVTISGYATLLSVPCFILLVWKATYKWGCCTISILLTDNCSVWVHLQGRSSQYYHREAVYDWSEDYHCSAFQEAVFGVSCSLVNGKKVERSTISFAILCLLSRGTCSLNSKGVCFVYVLPYISLYCISFMWRIYRVISGLTNSLIAYLSHKRYAKQIPWRFICVTRNLQTMQ